MYGSADPALTTTDSGSWRPIWAPARSPSAPRVLRASRSRVAPTRSPRPPRTRRPACSATTSHHQHRPADDHQEGDHGSFKAADKVYDGNTDAVVNSRDLTGLVGNDVVSLVGGSAAFDTKNVGTAKTVTLTGATLSGADAGNYSLESVATAKANISPKPITVRADDKSKVYGSADPALTVTVPAGASGARRQPLRQPRAGGRPGRRQLRDHEGQPDRGRQLRPHGHSRHASRSPRRRSP